MVLICWHCLPVLSWREERLSGSFNATSITRNSTLRRRERLAATVDSCAFRGDVGNNLKEVNMKDDWKLDDDWNSFFKLFGFSMLILLCWMIMTKSGVRAVEEEMIAREDKRDSVVYSRVERLENKILKLNHKVNHWNSNMLNYWRKKELLEYAKRGQYVGKGSAEVLVGRESDGKMYIGNREVIFKFWQRGD